jgi:DNA-binding XRE family transcriptional regulator
MLNKSNKAKEKLGKKIQQARKKAGYTQEELAADLRISRTHMGHIEQGRKSPSLELLEKIARALKLKVSDLFT